LEYVDYFFADDGTLFLRARLAAEDGVLLVRALEAARERVVERRREERAAAATAAAGDREERARAPGQAEVPADADAGGGAGWEPVGVADPSRPVRVEALLGLAEASLVTDVEPSGVRARVVVHVDAAALCTDGRGRSGLEGGPLISTETARRLGCDAEVVAQVERDGLPLSVGRSRRSVPAGLRRLLEARDGHTCCFPGCESRRHLQAHHRRHWAHGGETSLANLVLLCYRHHRLVHEGGYSVEGDPARGLCFRNRYGVVWPLAPPRPPPGHAEDLRAANDAHGLEIDANTNRTGNYTHFDLARVVEAIRTAAA
jgi:hypothetical protein